MGQLRLSQTHRSSAVLEPSVLVGRTDLLEVATTYIWLVVLIGGGYAGGHNSPLPSSSAPKPQTTERLVDRASYVGHMSWKLAEMRGYFCFIQLVLYLLLAMHQWTRGTLSITSESQRENKQARMLLMKRRHRKDVVSAPGSFSDLSSGSQVNLFWMSDV